MTKTKRTNDALERLTVILECPEGSEGLNQLKGILDGPHTKSDDVANTESKYDYKKLEELEELLVGKSIVEHTDDYILLDTGEKLEVKCTYSVNGAQAGGRWRSTIYNVPITDVVIDEFDYNEYDDDEDEYYQRIEFYNGATEITSVFCQANDGNHEGQSICSLVMGNIIFEVLDCGYIGHMTDEELENSLRDIYNIEDDLTL